MEFKKLENSTEQSTKSQILFSNISCYVSAVLYLIILVILTFVPDDRWLQFLNCIFNKVAGLVGESSISNEVKLRK